MADAGAELIKDILAFYRKEVVEPGDISYNPDIWKSFELQSPSSSSHHRRRTG